MTYILDRERLEQEIELRDTIRELRRQNNLLTSANIECHKEIAKLREALMLSGLGSGAGHI